MSSRSVTVLCVDDDRDFVKLAATFLEREQEHFTVLTETNASDALARLDEVDVDCIVSDYEMPRMDGLDFLRTVRETHPNLPFILFTGKGCEDVAADAIEAGVTSYLKKEGDTSQYALLANRIQNHTDQYRTEQHAHALEQEYELVAELATDAFWTMDVETGEKSFSTCLREFGYDPPVDADFDWWLDRVHPDDRERIERKHEAVLAREEAAFDELSARRGRFRIEFRWRRADGSYAIVEGRGHVLFEDGAPVKMVGTMTDVTEQRERESEIRQIKERYRGFIEHSEDIITILDDGGIIQYESPSVECVLGYAPEELEGENAFEYIHPDDREHARNTFATVITEPDTAAGKAEYRFKHADGSWVWLETRGSNRTDTAIDGYVFTTRDITERRQREQELEEKTERLDKFASVVSHDLRNPLGTARGYLELAQETGESEHLDNADAALARMESILEDVEMLAREGNEATDVEEVVLYSLVEKAWRTVDPERATLNVVDPLDSLRCDPDSTCRLLENLFRNAIDHGGDEVIVRVGLRDDGTGFYVEDDGEGIPDTTREELFDWGYTTCDDGRGFGLAIVEQIAEAHGWEVSVTESADGGARFEVSTDKTSLSRKTLVHER